MSGKIDIYAFGQGGVNLVKGPLHLADNELSQAQNAEIVNDQVAGGEGVLTKRGGIIHMLSGALNSSASILGLLGRTLPTTYTRTLLIGKGTEDSTTWVTTTNGTTLVNNTTLTRHANFDKLADENNARDARRPASFRNYVVYPMDDYTQDTDKPPLASWDGTASQEIIKLITGQSTGAVAFAITDMITANGRVYIAVHDPGGSGANLSGRVMSLDLESGKLLQIATAFGDDTGEMTGGAPSALCWYQNQLFVGLNGSATTNGIGKIVRCRPDTDTAWTSDVATLVSHVSSLCVFNGNLFAGTQSSVSTGAQIYERSSTTGTYTSRVTSGGGAAGSGHYASLVSYSVDSKLYAVEFHTTTPIVHIISSSDGTTWATSRDVDASDSGTAGLLPGNGIEFNNILFYVFRSTDGNDNDGFVMKSTAGTWSKLATDNYSGALAIHVARS